MATRHRIAGRAETADLSTRCKNRWAWKPRFSIRTCLIGIAVVGIYFACGRITASRGVREVSLFVKDRDDRPFVSTHYVAPFLYRDESFVASAYLPPLERKRANYYFWFFGYVAQLPLEREWTATVSLNEEGDFEETYFPIHTGPSRRRTAVPIKDWRMPYDDSVPAN